MCSSSPYVGGVEKHGEEEKYRPQGLLYLKIEYLKAQLAFNVLTANFIHSEREPQGHCRLSGRDTDCGHSEWMRIDAASSLKERHTSPRRGACIAGHIGESISESQNINWPQLTSAKSRVVARLHQLPFVVSTKWYVPKIDWTGLDPFYCDPLHAYG